MNVDFFEARDVAECDWALEEWEYGGSAWGAQGSVFVVWGAIVPGTETGWRGAGQCAWRVVRVH